MVIDGGCILWEVDWKIGATYAQFGDNFARKIKSMSAAMIVLIFDGYAPSAKDLDHASRQKYSCARQLVGKDKKILVNRNRFFSNGPNKECLIEFLRTWLNASDILQGSAVTLIIKKSDKDADTLTVKSAKEESEKTNQPVVVHGTDTDILMLLLFHGHMNTNLFYNNININCLWGLMSVGERQTFLVAYCFSGVDTVSSLFGKGKSTILKLFSTNPEVRDIIVPAFLNPSSRLERIDDLGIRLMRIVYGKSPDKPLSKLRYEAYNKQCLMGKVKPERLPPTKGATIQHMRRVFQQCCEWVLLDTDLRSIPLGWEWNNDRGLFLPIYSEFPAAPSELEVFISCNCEGTCSKNNCSCYKNNVKCLPSVCGKCELGGNCLNLRLDDIEESEEEDEE